MFQFTGTVVGYDDFLSSSTRDPRNHEFHVVVQEDVTGDRVRLRTALGITPIRLSDFGEDACLDDVRGLLEMGSRITFAYGNVADGQHVDPNFHEMDVIVYNPAEIAVAQCKMIAFPGRPRLELVHSV